MEIGRCARRRDGISARLSTFVLCGAGNGDHLVGQRAPRADPWVRKETKLSIVRQLAMRLISRLVGEQFVKQKGRCLDGIVANIVTLTTGLAFQTAMRGTARPADRARPLEIQQPQTCRALRPFGDVIVCR